MAGPGPKGSRVDYGAKGGPAKDSRSGDMSTPSSVSSQTNAKVPISGVENQNTTSTKKVGISTRKTTGGM